MQKERIIASIFKAVAIYSLIAWLYVVWNLWVFPDWQTNDLSQYVHIRTNLFGVANFVISFLSFLGWQITKQVPEKDKRWIPKTG